jgi:hypothetical protein
MLTLFAGFAYLFAWFREKEGGITLVVAGVVWGLTLLYQPGNDTPWNALYYSLAILIPGLMFWWVGNKKESRGNEQT